MLLCTPFSPVSAPVPSGIIHLSMYPLLPSSDPRPPWYLLDGLEDVWFVGRAGRDAAVAAQLQGGHEHCGRVLLLAAQAFLVVVEQLVERENQLGPVLQRGGREAGGRRRRGEKKRRWGDIRRERVRGKE